NMANNDKELARIVELVNSDPKKPPIPKEGIKDALLITSPIWDALLFAQKHRVLRLLLKEASYDARDDKLSLTLNENGIRFLHLLGEPAKCNSNPKSN
ncbi:MAG: hypothetical protein KKD29_03795, partial [Candidatus Omnitrophica bacterium]|nr:hypothetical protein [Candidatus Omnitrophota bacterium]